MMKEECGYFKASAGLLVFTTHKSIKTNPSFYCVQKNSVVLIQTNDIDRFSRCRQTLNADLFTKELWLLACFVYGTEGEYCRVGKCDKVHIKVLVRSLAFISHDGTV